MAEETNKETNETTGETKKPNKATMETCVLWNAVLKEAIPLYTQLSKEDTTLKKKCKLCSFKFKALFLTGEIRVSFENFLNSTYMHVSLYGATQTLQYKDAAGCIRIQTQADIEGYSKKIAKQILTHLGISEYDDERVIESKKHVILDMQGEGNWTIVSTTGDANDD